MNTKIVWAKVKGTNGCYEVSNMGEVRSLFYSNRNLKMRKRNVPLILKQSTDKKGYRRVCFAINGKRNNRQTHKIVLCSFGFEKPDGLQCAHLNGNPGDNRLVNLKWCTPKENQSHRKEHGTHAFGENANPAKLRESEVKDILKNYIVHGVRIMDMARKYRVNRQTIRLILKNKTWKHIDRSKYYRNRKALDAYRGMK